MSVRRTLFTGGTVISESGATREDLLVEDGAVVGRGQVVSPAADVVDCSGLLILPGLVDPHVHFCLEANGLATADDVATGSRSAVVGGVTTVADFTEPAGDSVRRTVMAHRRTWQPAACDWAAHVVVAACDGAGASEISELAAAGELRSVKVFTAYRRRGLFSDDEALFRVLEASAGGEFVTLVHAENEGIIAVLEGRFRGGCAGAIAVARSRPPEAEEEAVNRVLVFAASCQGRVHLVHLSCEGSVRRLAEGRAAGIWASGETCPHYLVLTEDLLAGSDGHRYATAPPLRTAAHAAALWTALARRAVQVIATDSCGFSATAKDQWAGDFTRIPGGVPGVEVSLRVMMGEGVQRGRIGMPDLVRLMSGNPARLLGAYPRKGCLDVGSDADIIVLDPEGRAPVDTHALTSRAGWSPYQGLMTIPPPERVYLRGTQVAARGRYVGEGVSGRPIERGRPIYPL
ncbi:MAG: amidohydrolase family protein [Candidatus Eisenbacteria bacterium]|jgi:dihydropyrimidinase|nr:amidohydrolase family protein [Candidatus Eisenbacteria bacterium]